jgi:hypothetical protein
VKAVHYVMRILHKNGRMLLQTIPGLISRAPDQVSNVVGFTREDLIQFFKRHSAIFQLHPDGCVSVKQDAVKALILKDSMNHNTTNNNNQLIMSNSSTSINNGLITNISNTSPIQSTTTSSSDLTNGATMNSPSLHAQSGVVLRIFPKYGILNMENNEQVFFDIQSCQFETFSDLTTILHPGDRLHFNAIIGPRESSTKWRSLKTWIKMKPQLPTIQQSQSMTIIAPNGMTQDNQSSHSDDAEKSDDSSTASSSNNNRYSIMRKSNRKIPSSKRLSLMDNGKTTTTIAASTSLPLKTSPSSNGNNHETTNSDENKKRQSTIVGLTSTGEFNQYQLEMENIIAAASSSLTVTDEVSNEEESASSSSPSLTTSPSSLSSSSAGGSSNNNHNQQQRLSISTSDGNISTALLHINSANNNKSSYETTSLSQKLEEINLNNSNNNNKRKSDEKQQTVTTQILKQSPDNISKREIHKIIKPEEDDLKVTQGFEEEKDGEDDKKSKKVIPKTAIIREMISIGCQTISTGDISVTNVYIE